MPETTRLSAELLSRLRLDRDADISVVRAAESLRKSDRVKLLALSQTTAHLLVRATSSTFSVALQVVASGRVQFKCECEAFKNGYVCAHILASVQTLADHLRVRDGGDASGETLPAKPPHAWETELRDVFGDLETKDTAPARRPPSQRHLLFFSVQERASDRWGVYPYSLPAKVLPGEFFDGDGLLIAAPDAVAKHIRAEKLGKEATGVRAVEAARFPYATAPERQAASLLSAVASLGGYGYYYGTIPAGLYEQVLTLLAGSGTVYHGTETTALRQRVDVCREGAFRPGVQVALAAPVSSPALPKVSPAPTKVNPGVAIVNPGVAIVNPVPPIVATALPFGDPASPVSNSTPVTDLRVAPVLIGDDGKTVTLSASSDKWAFKTPLFLVTGKGLMVPMPPDLPDIFGTLLARGEIVVPDAGKSLFTERYLLPLAEVLPVVGDAVVWDDAAPSGAKPVPRLYLSEDNTRLLAALRFHYAGQEYPFDPSYPPLSLERGVGDGGQIVLKRVARDAASEQEAYAALSGTGGSAFGLKREAEEPGHFTLRARVDPVDFLLHYVPKLAEAGYEVFGDESLQSVRVNKNKAKIAWNVSSGIDWFDLDAVVSFGDTAATFGELKRAIKRREKYVKLADGSIGVIPQEIVDRFRFLFALGEETKDGGLRLSPTQALLLEQAMADETGDFVADAAFYERREKLRGFSKIVAVPLPEVGLTANLYPYQKAGFDWLHFLHEYGFGGCLADEMGLGKAQPLDAKVLTPTGFVPMGTLNVGDFVIGANGEPTRVTGVFPQGAKQIFRVTFSDGAATECCDEHLWQVSNGDGDAPCVKPLRELRNNLSDVNGSLRYYVPVVAPVQFVGVCDPPVEAFRYGRFASGLGEIPAQSADSETLLPEGRRPPHAIPDAVKFGSVQTRLTVLQELINAHSHPAYNPTIIVFEHTAEPLVRDVIHLVRSLGGTAKYVSAEGRYGEPDKHEATIELPKGVLLSTSAGEAERRRPFIGHPPNHAIESVEWVGVKPAQCIVVEAADHLYVTDDFIVTHNTLSALSFILSLRKSGGNDHAKAPDIVIAPKSLVFNWEREAARFTPGLKTMVYTEGNRVKDPAAFAGVDVVLTTYGIMLRDIEHLRKTRFHYAVLDEAQAIKNPASQSARAARLLNCEHRLTLTGTPVENGTMELWSQFAFLNPGHLGNMERFREEFAGAIEKHGDEEAASTLRKLIAPFLLRRTKEQVAPQLPPRTEQIVYCEMDAAQTKRYEEMRDRYRAEVMGLLDDAESDRALAGKGQMKMLEALLRLRQVCNHPRLADPSYTGDSAKFGVLMDTIETLRADGHKALVFSQFVKMLDIIRAELDKRGVPYVYLDGSTRDRRAPVDRFQTDPDIPLFLISLKAGGVGLNLTAADYVLHVDPWWNPAAERQATDRAHRIGQDKPVFVQKFLTKGTVEEKILQLQERKRAITEQLITAEEGGFLKTLSRDDIAGLFT